MPVKKMLVCPPPAVDLCFVIFQNEAYLANKLSSVAGTFEVLAFVTVLFVLQIKNQLD